MRRSGVRIPLAPPRTDIRSGCRFFACSGVVAVLCRRWCSGHSVVMLCGALPLCVPVGGGPPARRPRRELRSTRRFGARLCLPDSLAPSAPATSGKQINMILCLDARQLSTLPSSIGTRHIGYLASPRSGGVVMRDLTLCSPAAAMNGFALRTVIWLSAVKSCGVV